MKLAELQALMFQVIRWPTGVEGFLAQASPEVRAQFDVVFAETPTFDRRSRVQVYAEAYFWRLAEVVKDQFPITAWLSGPKPFHNFLTDFVLAHPSGSPDVRRYGAGIPDAIGRHALGRARPELAAVANVEWAIVSAVDAADETPIDAAALAEIPLDAWPGLVLLPIATLRLVPCELDFGELNQAHGAGQAAPPDPPATPGQAFVVWRARNLDVYHRRLDAAESAVLAGIGKGMRFEDLCTTAAAEGSVDAATVAVWLRRWVDDGMLRGAVDSTSNPERTSGLCD